MERGRGGRKTGMEEGRRPRLRYLGLMRVKGAPPMIYGLQRRNVERGMEKTARRRGFRQKEDGRGWAFPPAIPGPRESLGALTHDLRVAT